MCGGGAAPSSDVLRRGDEHGPPGPYRAVPRAGGPGTAKERDYIERCCPHRPRAHHAGSEGGGPRLWGEPRADARRDRQGQGEGGQPEGLPDEGQSPVRPSHRPECEAALRRQGGQRPRGEGREA
eukprot:8760614-Alexandrium_andersonii.AAC.1